MLILLTSLFGLLIGSFLNVVAMRTVKGESIAYPPSHCDHCKAPLKPWDLVPVFSYLVLRGRCRQCRSPISAVYPLGEAAAAVLFGWTAWVIGPAKELVVGLFLVSVLMIVTHTDLRSRRIPDRVLIVAAVMGAGLRIWLHTEPLWNYAAAGMAAGLLFFLIAVISKGGMGGGDIKLFALIGMMLGLPAVGMAIFLACLLGSLYGLALKMTGRYRLKMEIPFAPFIAAGTLIAYFYSTPLIKWYMTNVLL